MGSLVSVCLVLLGQIPYGPQHEKKPLPSGVCEQQRHRPDCEEAFAFLLLKKIISDLASSEISLFKLVSVAEQAGFGMT